jgi:glycosyltransferase involved in cell wall biosynthesis
MIWMRIALINIPIKTPWLGVNTWITVPPKGYGGIQWVVKNLIDGLLELGNTVFLLGAPGSKSHHPELFIKDKGELSDIKSWLWRNRDNYDVIHDHSNLIHENNIPIGKPFIGTHHFTGKPVTYFNRVYLSNSQANSINRLDVPIVRIPVNPENYRYSNEKKNFFLYLGRVSKWKGVMEAAEFSRLSGIRLKVAGPAWEDDYLQKLKANYYSNIDLIGEVMGEERLQLLQEAKCVLAFSKSINGPWGDVWCEPGSTIVSEASASGTPVISSDNGCLKEITPFVGTVLKEGLGLDSLLVSKIIKELPSSEEVYKACVKHWDYKKIANKYVVLYKQIINGENWR